MKKVLHGIQDSKTCKCGQKFEKVHKFNQHILYYKNYKIKGKQEKLDKLENRQKLKMEEFSQWDFKVPHGIEDSKT